MNRSSRVRKPSQKAREIAESALLLSSKSSSTDPSRANSKRSSNPGKREPRPSNRAKVKIGSRKGRATINSNGDVDVEEEAGSKGLHENSEEDCPTEADGDSDSETVHDPDVLYCICLGHDDHTPMIQCEGCDNWFHFSCIHLDPAEAQEIAAFYCDVCHASGNGVTRKINEEIVVPEAISESITKSIPSACDQPREPSPVEAATNDTTPENLKAEKVDCPPMSQSVDLPVEKNSPEKNSPASSSPHAMKRSSSSSRKESSVTLNQTAVDVAAPIALPAKPGRRKPKLPEGLSSEEDTSDQDFTGDKPLRVTDRKRKTPTTTDPRPSTQPRVSVSTPFSITPPTPTTPVLGSEKTRRTCAEQFFKLFEPIFHNKFKQDQGDAASLRSRAEDEAMRFSEAVETELFENFAELDAHNLKAPRRQYMTKLRSLLFNLKNNPDFLNSLSSSELSPRMIVSMSHEDLQTPQQKALAEQIRQRSLQDSVKTLITGLEPINPLGTEKAILSQPTSAINISHKHGESPSSAPAATLYPLPKLPDHDQLPSLTAKEASEVDKPQDDVKENAQLTASVCSHSDGATSKALTSNLLGSFDLEKVFAAIKSVPAPLPASTDGCAAETQLVPTEGRKETKEGDSDESMDLENTPERELAANSQAVTQTGAKKGLPDDYDPFVLANGVDEDLDAILHGDTSTASPGCPTKEIEPQTVPESTSAPIVWTGNVMTADAGGFAACAVQVGGRPLSPDELTWSRLIPNDTMTVVGRLSVKDSTNYLVQSHFAPTRELVILDLRPNLKGPPELPSPERVTQHKQNLVEFFMKKGRHAVVAVNDKVKQTVRDIYLVPILRQDPLPEYVHLLDDVSIPEATPRDQDLMIAVLVLSKGVVPSICKPASSNLQQTEATAASGLGLNTMEANNALASSSSLTPVTSPYPVPPIQGMSASAAMPLLQSLGTNITSGLTPLPFSLLSQLPPSAQTTNAPGPPPGFVPYVPPQPNLPPASSSNPPVSALDLSNVDVSALQALLSNQQALQPILNQSHRHSQPPSKLQTLPPPLSFPPPLSQQNNLFQNNTNNGLRHNHQASTLPTPPRPVNLPLNPQYGHQNTHQSLSPPKQPHSWNAPDQQPHQAMPVDPYNQDNNHNNNNNNKQLRKGLMRMGEVIRSSSNNNEDNQRRRGQSSGAPAGSQHRGAPGGGARSKRHSYEFVAPPRDGGWAGRGRGKKID